MKCVATTVQQSFYDMLENYTWQGEGGNEKTAASRTRGSSLQTYSRSFSSPAVSLCRPCARATACPALPPAPTPSTCPSTARWTWRTRNCSMQPTTAWPLTQTARTVDTCNVLRFDCVRVMSWHRITSQCAWCVGGLGHRPTPADLVGCPCNEAIYMLQHFMTLVAQFLVPIAHCNQSHDLALEWQTLTCYNYVVINHMRLHICNMLMDDMIDCSVQCMVQLGL